MGVRFRSIVQKRWKLVGLGVILGGGVVWFSTDLFVANLFDEIRPRLEQELSEPLGHPLEIGPYRGLRFWGFAVGPTKVLSTPLDNSSAKSSGLTITLAPIASMLNRRPVATVDMEGARFVLNLNENGSYWIPGQIKSGIAPKFDLRIRLRKPAYVRFEPANFVLKAIARGTFNFADRSATGNISLKLPGQGDLKLKGFAKWDGSEFKVHTRSKRVDLSPLQGLFPSRWPFDTKGHLDGDWKLSLKKGKVGCKGDMALAGFEMQGVSRQESLATAKTSIRCLKDRIRFPVSKWSYGTWLANIGGDVLLGNLYKLDLVVSGSLQPKKYLSPALSVAASIPIGFGNSQVDFGDLEADLELTDFPLTGFGEIFETPMGGTLSGAGKIVGPLSSLRPNLSLKVVNPRFNKLRLPEDWQGDLVAEKGGGSTLRMNSVEAGIPGRLLAQFNQKWQLGFLKITRSDGWVTLKGDSSLYKWRADGFKLDGIEVSLLPKRRFERIFGELTGEGNLGLEKLAIDGSLALRNPRLMRFQLREALIKGTILENNFKLSGELFPPDSGQVSITGKGFLEGGLEVKAQARRVSPRWLAVNALQFPQITKGGPSATGRAEDLETINVPTFGGSLDGQIKAIGIVKSSLQKADKELRGAKVFQPEELRGQVDFDIDLKGPDIASLLLDFKSRGNIWTDAPNERFALMGKPFIATLKGPLNGGEGEFSFLNLPFSLLSLLAPVPSPLQGTFGLSSGRFRLGKGSPDISAGLTIQDASLAGQPLKLDRGDLHLKNSKLALDVALRSANSNEPVTLKGEVPVDSSSEINLKMESHGDGLRYLAGLSEGTIAWKSGTSDLRMYLKGTRTNPQLNGYLNIDNGQFDVMDQVVNDLNANIIFDFDRLEVQELDANIGSNGVLQGNGAISLLKPSLEKEPLGFQLNEVRLKLPVADVKLAGNLKFKGALLKPRIGGELTINDGSISPVASGFTTAASSKGKNSESVNKGQTSDQQNPGRSLKRPVWPEEEWDYKEPLVWLGRDVEGSTSKMLRAAIPNLSSISFDNLRLKLGPDLRITSPPVANFRAANFRTEGNINLNGSLDRSIQPSGVLRLLSGRVNAFTTTFNLVRSAPNVAVFTPSLGLVPYLDVSMFSRVSESVGDTSGVSSSRVFTTNGTGGMGVGGFRTVKVVVQATGPADRLSENFELRSSPPMPRSQLLELIGGNSMAGLTGDGEALTNVLGKSILTPVLGSVFDSFSDRLQVAIYPTYVAPEKGDEAEVSGKGSESQASNQDSGSATMAPQQAWVTEVGFDVSERLNFSVIATPNRNDIPPQGSLTYQFTPNWGVAGALDNKGTWQSQVQLFFRF